MRVRLIATGLACMLAALLATGAAGSSKPDVVIHFEKECPESTCEETPGSPVGVSATITPVDFEDGLFHYTSVETLSSSRGSVTVSLVGVLDLDAEPDRTVVSGFVIRGSWDGQDLAGASVRVKATRVSGSIFAGWIRITPGR